MQLNNIANGFVTVTLDYTDCYVLGEALEHMGGSLAGPAEDRYQVYEAMASAFLAAGMVGDMQGKVPGADEYTLERLRAEHMPAVESAGGRSPAVAATDDLGDWSPPG